jgi:CIC family chloride channel protein
MVGAAAFLGAGYRTPIAAVMFVAESTGRPGFVVPALIATAIAQLVMGSRSITTYQRVIRGGHVEERLRLPVTAALVREAYTVDADLTLSQLLVHEEFLRARARSIPVLEGDRYLGLVRLGDVAGTPPEERAERRVRDVLRTDVPTASSDWSLRRAVEAMEAADVDQLGLVDDGLFRGVIPMSVVFDLEQILEATAE